MLIDRVYTARRSISTNARALTVGGDQAAPPTDCIQNRPRKQIVDRPRCDRPVLVLLAALAAPFRLVVVDVRAGDGFRERLAAQSPRGRVPRQRCTIARSAAYQRNGPARAARTYASRPRAASPFLRPPRLGFFFPPAIDNFGYSSRNRVQMRCAVCRWFRGGCRIRFQHFVR